MFNDGLTTLTLTRACVARWDLTALCDDRLQEATRNADSIWFELLARQDRNTLWLNQQAQVIKQYYLI